MLALTHGGEKANPNSPHKKQPQNSSKILTSSSHCTLLFCCRAAAIAFAPPSPTWLPRCKTHVGIPAEKKKTTHKGQRVQSADFARFHACRKRCAIRI
jgi:hypothetical protein